MRSSFGRKATCRPRAVRGTGRTLKSILFAFGITVCGASFQCAAAQLAADHVAPAIGDRSAENVQFDVETMKARGLDPALARYFAEKPRFVAGSHRVSLSVNGEARGALDVRFDDEGKVCFDLGLMKRARLRVPDALRPPEKWNLLTYVTGTRETVPKPAATDKTDDARAQLGAGDGHVQDRESGEGAAGHSGGPAPGGCYDYRSFNARTVVNADALHDSVDLVVPADVLVRPRPGDGASSGGTGAMLNYNLMVSGSRSWGGATSTFMYGEVETGFNVGDWIVRSQQTYWRQQGESGFQMPNVHAQKTFVGTGYLVQLGQIAVNNPVVGGPPIEGIQIMPDDALIDTDSGAVIQGVATQQSRVEVRQAGALIYTTMVPPGPFMLRHVSLADRSSLIEVTLIDAADNKRRFTVAPASLVAARRAPRGLSLAIGRVYQYRAPEGMARPVVVSVAKGWNVGERGSISAGAVVSTRNQAVGVSHEMPLFGDALSITANATVSNTPRLHERGASMAVSMSAQLPRDVSLNLQASRQSIGFHTLSDALYDVPPSVTRSPAWHITRSYGIRDVMSGSASWNNNRFGAFSASFNRFATYAGFSGQHVAASWNRQFNRVSVSINVDRSLGRGTTGADSTLYASVSFPLGKVNMNTYFARSSSTVRGGISASQAINDFMGYNIGAERSEHNRSERGFGTMSLRSRFALASLNASAQRSSGALAAQIQGGVVVTRQGVTLSPYEIGDTFGVISAGNLSGVGIDTPAGTVWTDARGKAVIGSIPAYSEANTIVRTKTLPRNVDIDNGYAEFNAGRGSVSFIDIGVRRTKRMLLDVRMDDGSLLPVGSSIRDEKDNYVTTSVDDGVVYLESSPAGSLDARLPGNGTCRLQFGIPETADPTIPFTHVSATCRAAPATL
ncbi:fimbria/pilus outer membrane usher protein [Burkholderia metallica]|uniref:fimbria/pilus outer membrane usher protein n=1 Tax=Burkholderia metallica TaxID=488729 RepID=UPI0015766D20|nr:fimbria/pilus outer membrane usher protein [Burkholderia metallica]NTZ06310.1 fimbrial protein [Burkholderia metallica]